jgi:hypothetical protein
MSPRHVFRWVRARLKSRKMFFSEEKNQKTFVLAAA